MSNKIIIITGRRSGRVLVEKLFLDQFLKYCPYATIVVDENGPMPSASRGHMLPAVDLDDPHRRYPVSYEECYLPANVVGAMPKLYDPIIIGTTTPNGIYPEIKTEGFFAPIWNNEPIRFERLWRPVSLPALDGFKGYTQKRKFVVLKRNKRGKFRS